MLLTYLHFWIEYIFCLISSKDHFVIEITIFFRIREESFGGLRFLLYLHCWNNIFCWINYKSERRAEIFFKMLESFKKYRKSTSKTFWLEGFYLFFHFCNWFNICRLKIIFKTHVCLFFKFAVILTMPTLFRTTLSNNLHHSNKILKYRLQKLIFVIF